MPRIYDDNDFFWSRRGDYRLSGDGDIADTFNDPLRSVVQEAISRLKANKRDWKAHPKVGGQLADFVGELNNKSTAEMIKARIISALTFSGLIDQKDILVRYMPIDVDKIMFRITLKVAPTSRNKGSESLNIEFVYSYSDNNVYSVDKN